MPYSVSNKQKKEPFLFGGIPLFTTKSPSSGEAPSLVRGRLAWCLLRVLWLWLVLFAGDQLSCGAFTSREAGVAKRVPKETLRFLFAIINSYLVYRPEHGRTTRRT